MWIFLWDTAPSKIFVWDSEVGSVWVWDNKVWPTVQTDFYFDFTDGTWTVNWAKSDWWSFYGDDTVAAFWTRWLQRSWGTTSWYDSRWGDKSPFMYKKFLDNIQWLKEITITVNINWYSTSTWSGNSLSYVAYFFWNSVTQNWAYLPWNTKGSWVVRDASVYSMWSEIGNARPSLSNTWTYKYNFITWAYELSYSWWVSWVAVSGTDSNLNQVKNMLSNWLYIWTWMDYIWFAKETVAWINNLSIHLEME